LSSGLDRSYFNTHFVDGNAILNISEANGIGDEWPQHSTYDATNMSMIDVPAVSDGSGDATRAIKIIHLADEYGCNGTIWIPAPDPNPTVGSGAEISFRMAEGNYETYYTYNFLKQEGAWQEGHKMPSMNAYRYSDGTYQLRGTTTFRAWKDADGVKDRLRCRQTTYFTMYPETSDQEVRDWQDYDTGLDNEITFTDSTWHNVTMRYVAATTNTSGDGFAEVWLDGVHVMSWYNLHDAGTGSPFGHYAFNQATIRFFSGGSSYTYAPASESEPDQWVLIHDPHVFTYKSGYGPAEKGVHSVRGTELVNNPIFDFVTGKIK